MQLNDENMIRQAHKTHVQETEVIYWMLEDAIHEGKNDLAKGMLIDLLYIAKYCPDLLQKGLKKPFRNRLKEICHDLLGDGYQRKQKSITINPGIHARKIPFKLESELKTYLVKHKCKLESALKDQLKIIGTEIETKDNYKCDIVAESQNLLYPIELKIVQGTHAVVSQCSKYCYYFYRQLRYDRFKKVQGIVIAPGFDAWSVNELRRVGHWIFIILPDGKNDIKLERVKNH